MTYNKKEVMLRKFHSIADDCVLQNLTSFWFFLQNERNVSNNTLHSYFFDLRNFFKFYFDFLTKEHYNTCKKSDVVITRNSLQNCSISVLREWLATRLGDGITHRSNARSISAIKVFFKYLKNEDILSNEAIFQISKPRFMKALPKPINMEDFWKLNDSISALCKVHWQTVRDRAIVSLMFASGLRVSEALNVKLIDIEKRDRSFYVIGKGGKMRLVPIVSFTKDLINDYIRLCPYEIKKDSLLFLSNTGRHYTSRAVQRVFEKARRYANLPEHITPHTMRHSCATMLLENSKDADSLRKIQDLLGHSQLSTTQLYTRVSNQALVNALKDISYWNN